MAAPTGKGVTPVRSLRIPGDLWDAINEVAARNGESASAFVVRAAQAQVRTERAGKRAKS